jgi:Iron-containing alcohol dehydrogenase
MQAMGGSMSCCHYQPTGDGLDTAFTVDASRITFGRGCLEELGDRAQALGMTRVALFSDAVVARLSVFDTAQRSLRAAGIDAIPYTDVHIEPTDESFRQAAAFASQADPDGYVSVGGGSVIDTAKAANLYASYDGTAVTQKAAASPGDRPFTPDDRVQGVPCRLPSTLNASITDDDRRPRITGECERELTRQRTALKRAASRSSSQPAMITR